MGCASGSQGLKHRAVKGPTRPPADRVFTHSQLSSQTSFYLSRGPNNRHIFLCPPVPSNEPPLIIFPTCLFVCPLVVALYSVAPGSSGLVSSCPLFRSISEPLSHPHHGLNA